MHRSRPRLGALFPVLGTSLLAAASCLAAAADASSPTTPQGIVIDDDAALYKGDWMRSTKQTAVYGPAYRHDNHNPAGGCEASFTPKLADAGEYEVRLLFVPTSNRSTRTKVTLETADGVKEVTVDQRQPLLDKSGVPRSLGVYRFDPKAAKSATVTVTNEGADGFVVVDAVQFIPVALALQERAGKVPSGWKDANVAKAEPEKAPTTGNAGRTSLAQAEDAHALAAAKAAAAQAALSPLAKTTAPRKSPLTPDNAPIRVATPASPAQVQGVTYDVVVVGGTGSGVACAVRAAREGCRVLLVQHNEHIGGMMTNGLMQWDALYGGPRAPLFTELLGNIERHYIEHFGKDSPDHQTVRYTHEHYPISWGEPHVIEREFNKLVAAEKNVTLLLSHYPVGVDRQGSTIRSVTLRRYGAQEQITVQAATFVDATYEGDLFALAKVPYRVGREAREEYNEPHAGKAFVNIDHSGPATVSQERLNIRTYSSRQGTVDPSSPFTADGAVQAYNYRFCVTKDPDNRVLPTAP
ncbi:MAG: FAD-dependent oxidoreductase, partial [Verrucomicrobium sp.]